MPPRDDEVQALVEQLSADLDRSVLVDDASLRLLAYSPTLGSDDEVRKTAILTRETPRVIRDLHFAQGIANADPARPDGPAAGRRAGVAGVRADPLPGRALRLPVADRRRPVADRRRLRGRRAHGGRDRHGDVPPRRTREAAAGARGAVAGHAARATTPRQREAAATNSPRAMCWSPARRSECSRCAGPASRRPSSAPPNGPASGLALDQFRRTLPRRHALSTVHADHGVLVAALTERAGIADLARKAQDALDAAFTDDEPRDHRLHGPLRAPARRPPRPRARPARAARRRRRCRSMGRPPVGTIWAPTGCWPARPRRRTPAN